jgi:hypothetical protein
MKFMLSLDEPILMLLRMEADLRGCSLQELIRGVIVGEWMIKKKGRSQILSEIRDGPGARSTRVHL